MPLFYLTSFFNVLLFMYCFFENPRKIRGIKMQQETIFGSLTQSQLEMLIVGTGVLLLLTVSLLIVKWLKEKDLTVANARLTEQNKGNVEKLDSLESCISGLRQKLAEADVKLNLQEKKYEDLRSSHQEAFQEFTVEKRALEESLYISNRNLQLAIILLDEKQLKGKFREIVDKFGVVESRDPTNLRDPVFEQIATAVVISCLPTPEQAQLPVVDEEPNAHE